MKEKVVVDIVDEDNISLDVLYEQYNMCTKVEKEAKKQKEVIKKQIADFFDNEGEKDDFGNVRLFTGKGAFKKEIRKTVTLDPIFADPILKRLMIYDKVVTFEPVYDMDVIKEYFADGTISSELMEKMFKTEVSYALRTEEKAKTQKEEEIGVSMQ